MVRISTEAHIKGEKSLGVFHSCGTGLSCHQQADNYIELVEALLKSYGEMGSRMSLKVRILDARLDNFKEHVQRSRGALPPR